MPFPWKSFRDWLTDEEAVGNLFRFRTPIKAGDPASIVDAVPADLREEHLRVINCAGANGKQMETELRAALRYLHTLPGLPIGVVEQPVNNRPDIPVVINPWASRERMLRLSGVSSKDELTDKLANLKSNLIEPTV